MSEIANSADKLAENCPATDSKFDSLWNQYIESVQTDPTIILEPEVVDESRKLAMANNIIPGDPKPDIQPTNTNNSSAPIELVELSKENLKKIKKSAAKHGMHKMCREKKLSLQDLMNLPAPYSSWWCGLSEHFDDDEAMDVDDTEKTEEVVKKVQEVKFLEESLKLDIYDDHTPEDRTLPESPVKDLKFFSSLPNPKYSWIGGFGGEGVDKPVIPRKIPLVKWPNYDRPPHLLEDPNYAHRSNSVINDPRFRQSRRKQNRPPKRERERLAALAEASRLAAGDLPVKRPKGPSHPPKGTGVKVSRSRSQNEVQPAKKLKTVKSFKIVIKNDLHKYLLVSDKEFAFLMDLLLQRWDNFPANMSFVPKFNGHGCDNGVGWILCADEATCNWTLQNILDIAKEMEPHAKIRASTDTELIPGMYKATVEVPYGVGNTTALVFDRLTRANKGLKTIKWIIKTADPPVEKEPWKITLNIDESSVEYLKKLDFQPFYGLGRVTFKVEGVKKSMPGKSPRSSDKSPSRRSHHSSQSSRSSFEIRQGNSRSFNNNSRSFDDNNSRNSNNKNSRHSNGGNSRNSNGGNNSRGFSSSLQGMQSPWMIPPSNLPQSVMQNPPDVWNQGPNMQASIFNHFANMQGQGMSDIGLGRGGFQNSQGQGYGGYNRNNGGQGNFQNVQGRRNNQGQGQRSFNNNQDQELGFNDFDTFNQMMNFGGNQNSKKTKGNRRNFY